MHNKVPLVPTAFKPRLTFESTANYKRRAKYHMMNRTHDANLHINRSNYNYRCNDVPIVNQMLAKSESKVYTFNTARNIGSNHQMKQNCKKGT